MIDPTPMLPGLSPVAAKRTAAQFDGGLLSSDAGVLVLREIEQRLRVAECLATCVVDPRALELFTDALADIIRFRLLMIAGRRRLPATGGHGKDCVAHARRLGLHGLCRRI